jgi:hypothetical protein
MAVLRYRDPNTGQWVDLSTEGPPGPEGPEGPQGPKGDPGGSVTVSATPPANPAKGDLWLDQSQPTGTDLLLGEGTNATGWVWVGFSYSRPTPPDPAVVVKQADGSLAVTWKGPKSEGDEGQPGELFRVRPGPRPQRQVVVLDATAGRLPLRAAWTFGPASDYIPPGERRVVVSTGVDGAFGANDQPCVILGEGDSAGLATDDTFTIHSLRVYNEDEVSFPLRTWDGLVWTMPAGSGGGGEQAVVARASVGMDVGGATGHNVASGWNGPLWMTRLEQAPGAGFTLSGGATGHLVIPEAGWYTVTVRVADAGGAQAARFIPSIDGWPDATGTPIGAGDQRSWFSDYAGSGNNGYAHGTRTAYLTKGQTLPVSVYAAVASAGVKIEVSAAKVGGLRGEKGLPGDVGPQHSCVVRFAPGTGYGPSWTAVPILEMVTDNAESAEAFTLDLATRRVRINNDGLYLLTHNFTVNGNGGTMAASFGPRGPDHAGDSSPRWACSEEGIPTNGVGSTSAVRYVEAGTWVGAALFARVAGAGNYGEPAQLDRLTITRLGQGPKGADGTPGGPRVVGGEFRGTAVNGKVTIPHGLGVVPPIYTFDVMLGAAEGYTGAPGTDASRADATNIYGWLMKPDNTPYSGNCSVMWTATLPEAAILAPETVVLGPAEPLWNGEWMRPYGNGFQTPMLHRVGRMVTFAGLAQMYNAAPMPAGGVMGSVPVGYRPEGTTILRVIYNEAAGWVRVNLWPDGRITTSEPIPAVSYLSFHHSYIAAP